LAESDHGWFEPSSLTDYFKDPKVFQGILEVGQTEAAVLLRMVICYSEGLWDDERLLIMRLIQTGGSAIKEVSAASVGGPPPNYIHRK